MNSTKLVHIGGHVKICPSKIIMLKADINYTIIYLADGKQILSSTNLGSFEKRLKEFLFFRPNRSFVINLKFISNFDDATGSSLKIRMKNDENISISRRRTAEFLRIIQ